MNMTRILHAAFFCPTNTGWGLPLLFEGNPGEGKSAIIENYARRCGFHCEVLSGAERGEGAFGAIPVPEKKGATVSPGSLVALQKFLAGELRTLPAAVKVEIDAAAGAGASDMVIRYPRPDYIDMFLGANGEDLGGVIFADEISSSPTLLQAPTMGLVHAKRIGSYKLNPRVRVIGAMNPPEIAANGFTIAPPLANRFGWIRWEAPTVEEHVAYMLGRASEDDGKRIDALSEEARVKAAWGEAFARSVGLESAFLSAQADWKNKCPKADDPKASRAWCSDRSWENAVRADAAATVHGLSDGEREIMIAGFIGNQAMEAFKVFIEQADMPNAADVADEKIPFKHDGKRVDRSAAVLNSIAALVVAQNAPKRTERSTTLWKLLATVGSANRDIVVPVAQALISANLHTSKEAIKVLSDIHAVLQAASAASRR